MHSASVDYYRVLGVSAKATAGDIKQKYRELSKKYHPDTLGGDTKRMSLINEAYATLSDPLKKRNYQPPVAKKSRPQTTAAGYEKARAQPRRYTAAKKSKPKPVYEPINGWQAMFYYVLAVPAAILIVSFGGPLLQQILPSEDVATFNPQPEQTAPQTQSSAPATKTPSQTTTPPQTTPVAAPVTTPTTTTTTPTADPTTPPITESNIFYDQTPAPDTTGPSGTTN